MDVTLVRILTVVISLFTGVPIVLYLIALFVMPEEGTTPPQPPYVNGPQPGASDTGFAGQGGQPAYGAPAQPPVDQVWGPAGAPWEQPQSASPAGALRSRPGPAGVGAAQPARADGGRADQHRVRHRSGHPRAGGDRSESTVPSRPIPVSSTDQESDEKKI